MRFKPWRPRAMLSQRSQKRYDAYIPPQSRVSSTCDRAQIDPTSTSGFGLLDEMSLLELHERLAMLKLKCTPCSMPFDTLNSELCVSADEEEQARKRYL